MLNHCLKKRTSHARTIEHCRRTDCFAALRSAVTALGVDWQYRPLEPEPGLAALLAQPALDEGAKATVVQALGAGLIDVCIAHGYQSMDLVVLHPDTPGMEETWHGLTARTPMPTTRCATSWMVPGCSASLMPRGANTPYGWVRATICVCPPGQSTASR
jgi:hypothetical protein